MSDVSIIIPAYIRDEQERTWLFQAIQSVRKSSFRDRCEIIVVDDGSIRPIEDDPEAYRLVRLDRNRGPGAARNTGIHLATTPWIIPLDADDLINPRGIETLYHGKCEQGIVYGDLEYIDGKTGFHRCEDFGLFYLQRFAGPMPVTTIYTKQTWKAVGGYDESLEGLEDIDFVIRCLVRGICGQHIDGTIFRYRIHTGSRQHGLQDNGRSRLTLLHQRLIERHRSTWSKINMGNCNKCPGGSGPGPGKEITVAEGLPANAVNVKYIGPKLASFFEFGEQTHTRYLIEGKGAWFKVDPRDLDSFMMHRYGGSAVYIVEGPPDPVQKVEHMEMPAIDEVPDITTLSLAAAKSLVSASTDVLDLRVWLSEEQDADKPRPSLVNLMNAKLKELGD